MPMQIRKICADQLCALARVREPHDDQAMVLLQNDSRWGGQQLGDGESTIGAEGCGLLALVNGARRFGTWPDAIPPHANAALRRASTPPAGPCFVDPSSGKSPGSSLIFERAAQVLGMASPHAELVKGEAGDARLKEALAKILAANEFAIVNVDFVSEGRPRHIVLATGFLPDGRIVCDDSAVGYCSFAPDSLQSTVRRGKATHVYRVRSVRPLRPLPGAATRNFAVEVGSEGEAVLEVQKLLNERGYALKVDGKFGPLTKAAVEAFQERQGLEVDGVVGAVTSRALLRPR